MKNYAFLACCFILGVSTCISVASEANTEDKRVLNEPGIGLSSDKIPKRDPNTNPKSIDLSNFYNAGLKGTWHTNTSIPDSLKNVPNDLAELPWGLQVFAEVTFDVRGIIQLDGKILSDEGGNYPKSVDGISVNQSFEKIHVLHATGWQTQRGTVIGYYILHYEDGQEKVIAIVYGKHVLDWWEYTKEKINEKYSTIAWKGSNEMAKPIVQGQQSNGIGGLIGTFFGIEMSNNSTNVKPLRIFKTTWENPRPDVKVTSIDYKSTMSTAAPFLIAITVE